MSVLCALAKNAGDVVTRDDLIQTIWNVEFGADESLTRAISLLRKTFRNAGEPDGHIETIPKRGYRLVTPVSYIKPANRTASQHGSSTAQPSSYPGIHKTSRFSVGGFIFSIAILAGLFALIYFGLSSFTGRIGTQLDTGHGRSVAIMSFTDMSAKKDQEHVSDGVTEEIFTALADIPDLRIAARNSSFSYKGQPTDMRTIGEALNVSHIIDGSIRTQGDQIRITTQLIDTSDGLHVWSKSYDGTTHDIFGLQERVSLDIVSELRLVLNVGLPDMSPVSFDMFKSEDIK